MNEQDKWGEKHRNSTTPFAVGLLRTFIDSTGIKEPKILDFGVGQARNWPALQEVGYNDLTGLDISPLLLEEARQSYPDKELILVEDSTKTNLVSDSYDVILLMGVLVCITSLEVRENLLKEVARLLKSGGIIYLTDFMISESRTVDYDTFKRDHPNSLYGTYYSPRQDMNFHHMSILELSKLLKAQSLHTLYQEFPEFTSVSNSTYTGVLGIYQKC